MYEFIIIIIFFFNYFLNLFFIICFILLVALKFVYAKTTLYTKKYFDYI